MNTCKWHLCQTETKLTYCSKQCKNKQSVHNRRKKIKKWLVEYLGGECSRCGWKEHSAGLVAHHIDPKEKSFGIAGAGGTKSWDDLKKEADKCILLCANCHSIEHWENALI